jgi:hypothetical protein
MCFGTKIVLMKLHIPTLGPAFCNLTWFVPFRLNYQLHPSIFSACTRFSIYFGHEITCLYCLFHLLMKVAISS